MLLRRRCRRLLRWRSRMRSRWRWRRRMRAFFLPARRRRCMRRDRTLRPRLRRRFLSLRLWRSRILLRCRGVLLQLRRSGPLRLCGRRRCRCGWSRLRWRCRLWTLLRLLLLLLARWLLRLRRWLPLVLLRRLRLRRRRGTLCGPRWVRAELAAFPLRQWLRRRHGGSRLDRDGGWLDRDRGNIAGGGTG